MASHKKGSRDERKGKKGKQFLDDKGAALKLAEMVATAQEDISTKKVERHHQMRETAATRTKSKPARQSDSKQKLKDVKSALAAEAALAKREKAKSRKQSKARNIQSADVGTRTHGGESAPRKRVSFA